MRLFLALAVFSATLWSATSCRLPSAADLHLGLDGSSQKSQLTALVDSPLRWTSLAHKKRVLHGPAPASLASLPAAVEVAPPDVVGVGVGPLLALNMNCPGASPR